jgi:hypothetical protein
MNKRLLRPTIDDVAKLAGVSISMVSRVINRNVPISDDVVTRVEKAMKELRYAPRAAAHLYPGPNTGSGRTVRECRAKSWSHQPIRLRH